MDIFNTILIVMGIPALSYEIVYSELAHRIKTRLWLHEPKAEVIGLASFSTYWKIMDFIHFFLWLPLIAVTVALATIHRFLFKVLNCTYCLSFWLSLAVASANFEPVACVLLASCSLFVAGINNLIRKLAA